MYVDKGTDKSKEAFSGFSGTNLLSKLKGAGIERALVCGLATDYCVKDTAIDAAKAGFEVYVLTDAIAAVNINPGDEAKAITAMMGAGCKVSTTDTIPVLLQTRPKPTALIVVDVQQDFCPGGNLAVPEGDKIVPKINALLSVAGLK
jgi:nicotinamidase-related amidase